MESGQRVLWRIRNVSRIKQKVCHLQDDHFVQNVAPYSLAFLSRFSTVKNKSNHIHSSPQNVRKFNKQSKNLLPLQITPIIYIYIYIYDCFVGLGGLKS